MIEVSLENRRLAREASKELREMFDGDWSREDERGLAEWYQQLDDAEEEARARLRG